MRISPDLAHRLNNDIQEAMGALDIALETEDAVEQAMRTQQAKDALRRAAERIDIHTDRSLSRSDNHES